MNIICWTLFLVIYARTVVGDKVDHQNAHPLLGRLYYQTDDPNKLHEFSIYENGKSPSNCSVFLIQRSDTDRSSTDLALTAARCVYRAKDASDLMVWFPRSVGQQAAAGSIGVERAIIHLDYDFGSPKSARYNIALLKLKKPVDFRDDIQPLKLATNYSNGDCSFPLIDEFQGNKFKMISVPISKKLDGPMFSVIAEPTFGSDSFGGPLICTEGGQSVAQGIHAGGFRKRETFANIVSNEKFIKVASRLIDSNLTHEPFFYKIKKYHENKGLGNITFKQLVYSLEGVFGFIPETIRHEIQRNLPQRQQLLQFWYNQYVYKRINIQENKFAIGNIVGFTKENNTYVCAIKCMLHNAHGVCNYLPSLERCYFVEKPLKSRYVTIPRLQSLMIPNEDTRYFDEVYPSAMNKLKGSIFPQSLLTQKVSMWYPEWSFHCPGYLSSDDGLHYRNVGFATSCVQELAGYEKRLDGPQVTVVLDSQVLNLTLSKAAQIQPIRIPKGYPKQYGQASKLALKNYSPISGAFMSKPADMPWMVQIYAKRPSNSSTCSGVLINKDDVLRTASNTNSIFQYILTTATCAMLLCSPNQHSYFRIGNYFMDGELFLGKMIIRRRIHSDFNAKALDNNIALLEAEVEVSSNSGPLPSISLHKALTKFESYAAATWNVDGGDTYHPLYKIPVELAQRKAASSLYEANRLYAKGTENMDQYDQGKPLIGITNKKEAQLFGLYAGTKSIDGKNVEIYNNIRDYLPWIKDTVSFFQSYSSAHGYQDECSVKVGFKKS